MKYIYLFILLILASCDVVWAQDVPSGYTDELGLRLYDLDDYPGSDSLNANSEAIDAFAAATNDTILAVRTRIESVIKVTGGLKNAVVSSANLTTALDTSLVKTTGDDNVYGVKSFRATTIGFKTAYPPTTDQYNIGRNDLRWQHMAAKRFYGEQFILVNPSDDTDTLFLYYNNGKVKISGSSSLEIEQLNITTKLEMDSSAALGALKLQGAFYSVPDYRDSVITIDSIISNLRIELPAVTNAPGIESINISGAAVGNILIVYTTDAFDSVLFRTTQPDGNIYNGTAFYLKANQNAAFMYIYNQPDLRFYWMPLWVKKN